MPPPWNNKLSAGGMVHWLLNEARDKLRGLQTFMHGWLPDPKPSGKEVQPGLASLAPGISLGRVLPALGKPDTTIYDEELGFLDLDNDPDVAECIMEDAVAGEPEASKKEEPLPYVYLATSEALAEFVRLYSHVCLSEGCGHRMGLDRMASITVAGDAVCL